MQAQPPQAGERHHPVVERALGVGQLLRGPHLLAERFGVCGQLDGIIFIIDSADRERISEAKKELDSLLATLEARMAQLSGHV